jgi:hypothetical protein
MHKYLVLFLIIGISNAGVLLTNGDFEEPLATGWFQGSSGSGFMTIVRETYYDPDPDYEVFVHKGDETGSIKLFQTVVIPTTDLEFSVNANSLNVWMIEGIQNGRRSSPMILSSIIQGQSRMFPCLEQRSTMLAAIIMVA